MKVTAPDRQPWDTLRSVGSPLVLAFSLALQAQAIGERSEPKPGFTRDVQPILDRRCRMCHSGSNRGGGLSVETAAALLAGGSSGPAVKAGSPEESLLIRYVAGPKPRMPKGGAPLTAGEVETLRRWMELGARDDSNGVAPTWWSLRPLVRPLIPAGAGANPIDAFLSVKRRQAGLEPNPQAPPRVLIRRLYLDLTGLPPTPEEADHFAADPSDAAYRQMVDRLLQSPRYGERWARHWMDAVHYGESHGYDKDKPRLNAWPYRDYLIDAFNRDLPYSRFVEEQLAADVLFPADTRAFPAIGFLAAGPWDFVGHQELREGTADKDLTRLLDRDDMVATAMTAFTSMTAHCARCHDHKFDPIPQRDYYALQAVFAGVDRADRPFDAEPALHQRRQQLLKRKQEIQAALQPLLDRIEFATSPEIVALDNSIQDAGLLLVHMGTPKTPAEQEEKRRLEARRASDREKRKQLVDALVGPDVPREIEAIRQRFVPIDAEIATLPPPRRVYAGAAYFDRAGTFRPPLVPRAVHVLDRGNVRAPKEEARPGALSAVAGLNVRFETPADGEGGRRAALAGWITDRGNMLTWRSIVNRVWQGHFGTGIADTPNDFGRMGSQPTHPELLDWLAVWFRDDAAGSLKQLHRLIVTSDAYRQASSSREDGQRADADNRLLWRMNRSRLDAESFRDAVLAVAGKLDLTMGGPPVQMFAFKDDHSPVYDYARFSPDGPGAYRRSIYRFIVRSVPDPFLERLDCPDPSVLTPKRSVTITAIQALATWNNTFVLRMAEHFAARLFREAPDTESRVRLAVRLAFGREPAAGEVREFASYAEKHGFANLCRVIFNANEFLFAD